MPFDSSEYGFAPAAPAPVAPTSSPVVRQLKAGRERIANGWCNRGVGDCLATFCIIASIVRRSPSYATTDAAQAALTAALPLGKRSLLSFNEAPETTQADVLALFDRAIAAAEAAS